MDIYKSISELPKSIKGAVVSIGNFDGVHIGHQEILKTAKAAAEQKKTKLLIVTFQPHPAHILKPEKAPAILTPPPLKQQFLLDYGADGLLIINPEAEILSMPPQDFIEKFVLEPIMPSTIVEGEDFNFGANRSGDVKLLQQLASAGDFDVTVVNAKKIKLDQTVRISSTIIRYMLEGGEVADAAVALGRPYKLIGKIVQGKGKGKQLGFPTLNMQRPEQLIPAEGVYAGYVSLADSAEAACRQGEKLKAVFSIGQARTFGDEHPLLIEAHLLSDVQRDVTGKCMAMDFVDHIRSQHKFTTPEELSAQIAKDCEAAKDILR